MDTRHLEIEDALIDEAFDREYITDWDRTFMLGLVDYSELTEKQEVKFRAILKKIERGQNRSGTRTTATSTAKRNVCKHCGHPQ